MLECVNKGNMYNSWFCVLNRVDVCVFFHFLSRWIGSDKPVQFPTVSWSIIVSQTLFLSLFTHFNGDWARQRLPGVNGPDIYIYLYTVCILGLCAASARGDRQGQLVGVFWGFFFFSCFDCFCLGTKMPHADTNTPTHTHLHTLLHNGIMWRMCWPFSFLPLSCSKYCIDRQGSSATF